MGNYVSVRGWLELDEDMIPQVQEIIGQAASNAEVFKITIQQAEFYKRGWVFPDKRINWTYYCFYGADIRIQHLDYLKTQLKAIAENVQLRDEVYVDLFKDNVEDERNLLDCVEGTFFVDDEDKRISLIWSLSKGAFHESRRAS